MKRLLSITALSLTLGACSTYQPDIVQTGPQSYYILKEASSYPGVGILKSEVTKTASGFCKQMGRKFHIVSIHETKPPYNVGNRPRGEIKFQCVRR